MNVRGNTLSSNRDTLSEITRLPVTKAVKLLNLPTSAWVGNCHLIAGKLLQKNYEPMLNGKLCYGHWLGYIGDANPFAGRSFTHHGWVEVGKRIIDPTRWVFEEVRPYIYIGPNDHYDDGGQIMALARHKQAPSPKGKAEFIVPENLYSTLKELSVSETTVTINQLSFLANLPPKRHNNMREIYEWIISINQVSLIPIDFRRILQIS